MNVITLDAPRIIARLNTLPPKSRLRPGYVDMLRAIRAEELWNEKLDQMLPVALHDALATEFGRR